jgi:hypothetical protein
MPWVLLPFPSRCLLQQSSGRRYISLMTNSDTLECRLEAKYQGRVEHCGPVIYVMPNSKAF